MVVQVCLHYAALYGAPQCISALFAEDAFVRMSSGPALLRNAHVLDSQGFHRYARLHRVCSLPQFAIRADNCDSVSCTLSRAFFLPRHFPRCLVVLLIPDSGPPQWQSPKVAACSSSKSNARSAAASAVFPLAWRELTWQGAGSMAVRLYVNGTAGCQGSSR